MGEAISVFGEGSLAVETFTPAETPPATDNFDGKIQNLTGDVPEKVPPPHV